MEIDVTTTTTPREAELQNDDLYHYCSLQNVLEDILPNRRLRLGWMKNSNDPRENKGFQFGTFIWGDEGIGDLSKLTEEISEVLRDDCKMICFSKNYKQTLGSELSPMWAHYGGKHKGICLKIDKEKFLEENKDIIDYSLLQDINYDDRDEAHESRFFDFDKMKNDKENT